MKKSNTVFLNVICVHVVFVLFVASSSVMAQYSNYYVGVYGGKSNFNFEYHLPFVNVDPVTGDIVDGFIVSVPLEQKGNALGLLIGYDFNDNFQAEFSYLDFAEVSGVAISNSFGIFSVSAEYSVFMVNGVGTYPISRRWRIHGKIGLSQSKVKSTIGVSGFSPVSVKEDGDGFHFSVGTLFKISRAIDVTLDFYRADVGSKSDNFEFSADGKSSGALLGLRYNY